MVSSRKKYCGTLPFLLHVLLVNRLHSGPDTPEIYVHLHSREDDVRMVQ